MAVKPSLTISIEGMPEVARAFNNLPPFLQTKMIRPSMRAGAKVVQKHAVAEARAVNSSSPAAPHMSDKIRVKAMKRKKGRVGFMVITAKREELGITDPDSYYPAHVEYGYLTGRRVQGPVQFTETRRTRKGRFATKEVTKERAERGLQASRRHIPANPWMKRALEKSREAATRAVGEELKRRLEAFALGNETAPKDFWASEFDAVSSDEAMDGGR
jgi:hypothetical protein